MMEHEIKQERKMIKGGEGNRILNNQEKKERKSRRWKEKQRMWKNEIE